VGRWFLLLLLALLLVPSLGCGDRGGLNFVNTPSAGRAETCPNGAVGIDNRMGYDPNTVKCSYSDAIGDGVTTISGQVRAADGGLGVAVPDLLVTIHAIDGPARPETPGPALGKATTDAQGSFRFSAVLDAGEYLLIARAEVGGQTLAFESLSLEEAQRRKLEDVLLWLPVDERISSPSESR
jgi:hypothetical protein